MINGTLFLLGMESAFPFLFKCKFGVLNKKFDKIYYRDCNLKISETSISFLIVVVIRKIIINLTVQFTLLVEYRLVAWKN